MKSQPQIPNLGKILKNYTYALIMTKKEKGPTNEVLLNLYDRSVATGLEGWCTSWSINSHEQPQTESF